METRTDRPKSGEDPTHNAPGRIPDEDKSWAGAPRGAPAEALKDFKKRLGELGEYVSYYFAAKSDAFKLSMKNAAIYAALGVVGLIAAGALLVTAVVLLCTGVAGGLGALFGDRYWLGALVTGVLFLGLIGGGTYFALSSMVGKSRKATVHRYEARQRKQRADFGHDVCERAQSQRRHEV